MQLFDEDVDVCPPAEDSRPEFSARLHAHAVDEAGDWWARVTPDPTSGAVEAQEWVPVWWVFRAPLADDDGLVEQRHLRLLP